MSQSMSTLFMTGADDTVYQFVYRAVLGFEGFVGAEEYHRLLNFPFPESRERVDECTYFVRGLNIKKINGRVSYPVVIFFCADQFVITRVF
jgi:hypothetical protein